MYVSTRLSFIPQGILLVYDITNGWSFDGIDRWIREIDEVSLFESDKRNVGSAQELCLPSASFHPRREINEYQLVHLLPQKPF